MTVRLEYSNNVGNWLSVGRRCQSNTALCLGLAQAHHLAKLYPSFSYAPIGSYGGYLQFATRANADQQLDIEEIANWSAREQMLSKLP